MASRVAEILMEQGRNAAEAARAKGAIWGGLAERLGQLPGEVIQQQQQQKRQDLQSQITKQNLAIGGEELQQFARKRQGQDLAKSLYAENTAVDETGHLKYNDEAIVNGFRAGGFDELADHHLDFGAKLEDHIANTQVHKAAYDASVQKTYADTFGALLSVPEAKRAEAYPVWREALRAKGKNDPVFGALPESYPGHEAFNALYESHRTNAERLAAQKEAAAEHRAGIKEVPKEGTLVDVGDIDPTTGKPRVLATGAPADKRYEQKSVLLDGKPAEVHFDPATGKHFDASGADVSSRVKPIPPQANVTIQQNASDAKDIADSIQRGEQPPDVKGLYRLAGPVRAELAKQGYDLTTANLDWQATQKHTATMNNSKFTALRTSITTASESLDVLDDLAKKWDAGRFALLNKASLKLAKGGVYGKEAASIATQLEGQITDVTSELGNVYMGGNSPTDHALQLAGKNLSADWDKKVLLDM